MFKVGIVYFTNYSNIRSKEFYKCEIRFSSLPGRYGENVQCGPVTNYEMKKYGLMWCLGTGIYLFHGCRRRQVKD
jgi:hypothetical protein